MALAPGVRLGIYDITAQIGQGGMGDVYRATDTRLKRQVAIKILPPAVAIDPDRLARFHREAELLASLNHPHIAAIYGLEDGHAGPASQVGDAGPFLVMELVEGPTLAQLLAGVAGATPGTGRDMATGPEPEARSPQPALSRLPVADALNIARQVAEALEAAHKQGLSIATSSRRISRCGLTAP